MSPCLRKCPSRRGRRAQALPLAVDGAGDIINCILARLVEVIDGENLTVLQLDRAWIAQVCMQAIAPQDQFVLEIPAYAIVGAETGANAIRGASIAIGHQQFATLQRKQVLRMSPDGQAARNAPSLAAVP